MDVPYTHAAKVVAELQHLGLLAARRGRGGGLSVTEAGRTASVGPGRTRLRGRGRRERRGRLRGGGAGSPPCPLRSDCLLRGALRRAQEAFFASLDPLTVQDMIAAPTGPLLLGISGRPTSGLTSDDE